MDLVAEGRRRGAEAEPLLLNITSNGANALDGDLDACVLYRLAGIVAGLGRKLFMLPLAQNAVRDDMRLESLPRLA